MVGAFFPPLSSFTGWATNYPWGLLKRPRHGFRFRFRLRFSDGSGKGFWEGLSESLRGLLRGAVCHHGGVPENSPLTLMGCSRTGTKRGPFSDLNGPFPRMPSWAILPLENPMANSRFSSEGAFRGSWERFLEDVFLWVVQWKGVPEEFLEGALRSQKGRCQKVLGTPFWGVRRLRRVPYGSHSVSRPVPLERSDVINWASCCLGFLCFGDRILYYASAAPPHGSKNFAEHSIRWAIFLASRDQKAEGEKDN